MHPYAPQQKIVMRWEFMLGVEAYFAGIRARCRTLEDILAQMNAYPETMRRYGDGLLRNAWEVHSAPGGEAEYRDALRVRTIERFARPLLLPNLP